MVRLPAEKHDSLMVLLALNNTVWCPRHVMCPALISCLILIMIPLLIYELFSFSANTGAPANLRDCGHAMQGTLKLTVDVANPSNLQPTLYISETGAAFSVLACYNGRT